MAHLQLASSREERRTATRQQPVLVEGDGHHAVAIRERLLHAVAVVQVDVDVEDARPTSLGNV